MYLSIYTPKECTPESPCAVMMWIYGGAWIFGGNDESKFDGTRISRTHKVVVVAPNYRYQKTDKMKRDRNRGM